MQCKNHLDVAAVDRCSGCAEPFCSDCLVEIHGQKYCGACKMMTLRGAPGLEEEPNLPCKEANEALICAILGLFCFGIILEPVALSKAWKARQMMVMNPRLEGAGKVAASFILGAAGLLMWLAWLISRFNSINTH